MAERRYTLLFVGAIVVALAATIGVSNMVWRIRQSSRIVTANVVVAQRDIPEGHQIDATDVRTSQWPVASVPAGAFFAADSVVGRVTRLAVFTGEPIVPGRLAPTGTGAGIEVKITPGKRAMAIRIDEVAGLSGLIQPNSRVDLMITMKDENNPTGKRVAKLFMENMRVLSVGTQIYRGEDGKPIRAASATLEVTPDEAERLAIAAGSGPIQLVLRGYGDPDSVKTGGATSSDVLTQLRGAQSFPPPRPEPVAPRHIAAPKHVLPPPVPVAVAPPPPKRGPDSVTVQVFRAGKPTAQHFERDSTAPRDTTGQ